MNILLNLHAPMQSWGDHTNLMTKGNKRGSYPFPTYSGVLGIVCSSMGINRDRHPDRYSELRKSFNYDGAYCISNVEMLTDYQTMGGGYNATDKHQRKMTCVTKNGKIPSSGGWNLSLPTRSKISERDYIMDAKFMVIISVDYSIADSVITSLKNPTWIPVLGRSSCIPSGRIYNAHGTYDDLIELIRVELINDTDDKLLSYVSLKPTSRYSEINVYDVPDEHQYGKYHHRRLYKTIT